MCIRDRVGLDLGGDPRRGSRGSNPTVEIVEDPRDHDDRDERRDGPAHEKREKRKTEDVEAKILVKKRIGPVEHLRVGEQDVVLPLSGGAQSGDRSSNERNKGVETPGIRTNDVLEPTNEFVLVVKREISRTKSVSQEQVAEQDQKVQDAERDAESDLDFQQGRKDAGQTERGEPQLVRPQNR